MSDAFKQVIESIRELSANERALVAHCLISSLDLVHEEGVDEAWAELAQERYQELESGVAKSVTWQEIINAVKCQDA